MGNVAYIKKLIDEKRNILKRIESKRRIARSEKSNSSNIIKEIEMQKSKLFSMQNKQDKEYQIKNKIEQSMDKIIFLIEETEREIREIKKIRFVNKKLDLFSSNTCPYCLSEMNQRKRKMYLCKRYG